MATTDSKRKRGRPEGTFKGDEIRAIHYTIRLTETENARLHKEKERLKLPISDIFRGFINELPEPVEIEDPITVKVSNIPMVMTRKDAKQLLKDLTAEIVK